MGTAVVIVAIDQARGKSTDKKSSAKTVFPPNAARLVRACAQSGYDEAVVVVSSLDAAAGVPDGPTIVIDEAAVPSLASAVRVALDYCARAGHSALVVAEAALISDQRVLDGYGWGAAARPSKLPIACFELHGHYAGLVRVDEAAWPLVPLEGGLDGLWRARSELVDHIAIDFDAPVDVSSPLTVDPNFVQFDATQDDIDAVARLLGRAPAGRFRVAVRDSLGEPVVIENAPFFADGTPMPTRFWLVGAKERHAVGTLESTGGNAEAERVIDAEEIVACHERYEHERDARIPADHDGPRPSGGVGGTRVGVKCLHAHLAYYLAGGADPVGRWTAIKLSHMITGPVAAIDCGTNSTRLLILDRTGLPVERHMTITRLGQDVDRTGELAADAIARNVAAIANYRSIMDRYGVVQVRAVATSAARDARNADEFFDRVEAVLGVRPELIDGNEEGALSYRGATVGLNSADGPFLICDLGGGSTELVTNDAKEDGIVATSMPLGCVRVTERFLHRDPPQPDELVSARDYVRSVVEDAITQHPEFREAKTMIGVAGTVATLVTLDLRADHYDPEVANHRVLTRTVVEALLTELSEVSVDDRRKRPGIETDRADVIVGGTAVLAEVMAACGFASLIYSESDILDGVAAALFDHAAKLKPASSLPGSANPFMSGER